MLMVKRGFSRGEFVKYEDGDRCHLWAVRSVQFARLVNDFVSYPIHAFILHNLK